MRQNKFEFLLKDLLQANSLNNNTIICGVDSNKVSDVARSKTIVSTNFYGGNNLIAVEFFCLKATDPNAAFIVHRNFQKVFSAGSRN